MIPIVNKQTRDQYRLSMLRFYLPLALIPIAFFSVVLILIHAQPYDDHELRELLLPEGCPAPCFMGIRPGITTVDEAVKILEASGRVERIVDHSSDYGMITWYWNNQNPFNWTEEQLSGFVIVSGHVDHIVLDTELRLGEIRLIFGIPDTEFAKADNSRGKEYATYWANYWQHGLIILGSQPCDAIQPLFQLVTLSIGQVTKSSANAEVSSHKALYEMPRVC